MPWPPAGRREAGELTTYLREGKLRRCVRYEHVQLISCSHSNVCSHFLFSLLSPPLSLSLCTLSLSLCLIRSLRLINSQVCLQWVKHEVKSVCACVHVCSPQATPALLASLNNFSSGFSFGQPSPQAKCSSHDFTVCFNAGKLYKHTNTMKTL